MAAPAGGGSSRAPASATGSARTGRFRRFVDKVSSRADSLDAAELQGDLPEFGATAIGDCGQRQRVCVAGVLRTVTLRPMAGIPVVEAELWDGKGTVALMWLGRRRIAGITPGRVLIARGRLSTSDGRQVIFNPDYELRAGTAD